MRYSGDRNKKDNALNSSKPEKEKAKKDIREVALRKLARSNKTAFELSKKLNELGYSEEEIKSTIEDFIDLSYLDDEKYASSFFRLGKTKGWSIARIKRELKNKGVSSDVIEDALKSIEDEEINLEDDRDTAFRVARKMAEKDDLNDRGYLEEKVKNRIARRLFSYGYGSDIIFSVIRKVEVELAENQ